MIFKETDREDIKYIMLNTSRISEKTSKLYDRQCDGHDEVTAKLDSIEHSIEALSAKIDALTQLATGATDIFQDLGNAMNVIRDLSKVDSEVHSKQFEAIVAGVELIIDKLGGTKDSSYRGCF